MSIWLFGKSSEFSQHMASQWKEDGHDVNEFGRSDVNYADPEKFIAMVSKLTIPNYVVFNINVGVPFECSPNLHKQSVYTQKLIFKEWFDNNLDVNFFKMYIFNWLIDKKFKGDIAHITSQIAKDTNPEYKGLLNYKMQRALDYQIIQNQRAYGINSYGICPANIQDSVAWPKYMAKLICDKDKDPSWLFGIIKEEDQLNYICYPSEGLYDKTNDLP